MPGSIQVSVLDFKELPLSSNCVKISLGKVEHEAGENGTFSFPLTNLRDNLIITVRDSEGKQVSQSGVRTMTIIEKGTWDDVFSVEGGGRIHMKLQFFLNDDERNRIRLMREAAMKKKQAEILGSRHEVSGSESCDEIKGESFQGQSFPNVTDKSEETSSSHMTQEIEQRLSSSNILAEKLYEETLEEKVPSDVKETDEDSSLNKNNAVLLQQVEVPGKLPDGMDTRDILKDNNAIKSEPLNVEKVDKPNLEDDKNPNFVKRMNKERKFPPFLKETEAQTVKNNEIQLQETDLLKGLQGSSSRDVGSSRLTFAEKIKSFSPKLGGEMDRQGSLKKTPQNIKKMISVFESTISQDRVPLSPASTKLYRFGTSRLLKDNTVTNYYEKSESSLKNSEKPSSSRLRNSFSTGDLRKSLSNIITKGDQVEFDDNFVEPSENIQSKGNDPKGAERMGTETLNNRKNSPESSHEGINNEKESIDDKKTLKVNAVDFDRDGSGQWTFPDEKQQVGMTAQGDKTISLLSDCKIEEKGHQEKIVASTPEILVKGEEIESPESADVETSNGSFGQAMKIALVVGFGVLVLIFRPRESGKGKRRENTHTLRNQVLMSRRGSIEQGRRIGVSRLS